jgi:formylglycine-generating enzyme
MRGRRVALAVLGAMTVAGEVRAPSAPGAVQATMVPGSSPLPVEHRWQEIEGKYWQIVSPDPEEPDLTDAAESTRGACAAGMVEIQGRMKVEGPALREPVEDLQKQSRTDWITRE